MQVNIQPNRHRLAVRIERSSASLIVANLLEADEPLTPAQPEWHADTHMRLVLAPEHWQALVDQLADLGITARDTAKAPF